MAKKSSGVKGHKIASRKEWLKARIALLKEEKALTRRSDEVARKRQALPWVRIDKKYQFETDEGKASLADLFRGRSQILIYHFMFGPDYAAGCPACSSIADGFNGFAVHLANHDVMLWAVLRAPFAKLQAYKKRMGWTFPWASSFGGDFNLDFSVHVTEEQQRKGDVEYNYNKGSVRSRSNEIEATDAVPEAGTKIAASVGTDWPTYIRERPGMRTASSITLILRMRADWMVFGAYTSGLTAPPGGATRLNSGFGAATNTTNAEPTTTKRRRTLWPKSKLSTESKNTKSFPQKNG
jgi:predicted dithiol-disulfide oxidoreductase (DUF899 family)